MDEAATPTAEPASDDATPQRRAGDHAPAIVLFVVTTLAVLAGDLLLKYAAFHTVAGEPVVLDPAHPERPGIPDHPGVDVVPGVLSLRLTTNTGAVFGLGKGGRWLFIVVSVIAVVVISRIFWRSPAGARGFHLALGLILAGALGNLYDRFMYSAVRDMLHLFPGAELPFGWAWPGGTTALYPWIFNLADAALVVGVLGVLAITWLHELRRRKLESNPG